MIISFIVPGFPEGKRRPRFARVGKNVRTYNPEKDKARENAICIAYREAAVGVGPYAGPIIIAIDAMYAKPKSWSEKRKSKHEYKTSRPDADNVGKLCCDALNGIAYLDDAQIIRMEFSKRWGDHDEISVIIERIGEAG
jgi:Holliday junction resolvase RusA-like endonuclease